MLTNRLALKAFEIADQGVQWGGVPAAPRLAFAYIELSDYPTIAVQ
ncbi:MAG: hypothetical protein IPM60_13215 [Rhodospirillales bacterium]|nr:hypothetical protein [Rhodospirillales bacterium]